MSAIFNAAGLTAVGVVFSLGTSVSAQEGEFQFKSNSLFLSFSQLRLHAWISLCVSIWLCVCLCAKTISLSFFLYLTVSVAVLVSIYVSISVLTSVPLFCPFVLYLCPYLSLFFCSCRYLSSIDRSIDWLIFNGFFHHRPTQKTFRWKKDVWYLAKTFNCTHWSRVSNGRLEYWKWD